MFLRRALKPSGFIVGTRNTLAFLATTAASSSSFADASSNRSFAEASSDRSFAEASSDGSFSSPPPPGSSPPADRPRRSCAMHRSLAKRKMSSRPTGSSPCMLPTSMIPGLVCSTPGWVDTSMARISTPLTLVPIVVNFEIPAHGPACKASIALASSSLDRYLHSFHDPFASPPVAFALSSARRRYVMGASEPRAVASTRAARTRTHHSAAQTPRTPMNTISPPLSPRLCATFSRIVGARRFGVPKPSGRRQSAPFRLWDLVFEENVNSSILELIVQIHRRRIHRRFTNRQTGEQPLSVGISATVCEKP